MLNWRYIRIVTSGTGCLHAVLDLGHSQATATLSPLPIPPTTRCIANLWNAVSVQQSTFGQAGRFSPSQEISRIFWKAEVHNSPALVPSRSQMNPLHSLQSRSYKIHSNIILPSTPAFPSGLFPSGPSTKILYQFPLSPICAIFPAHLSFFDMMTPQ